MRRRPSLSENSPAGAVGSKMTRPLAFEAARPLYAAVIVFGLLFTAYARLSSANVAYLSWFAHVPMIERAFAGTLEWTDLVQRYGEHGLFGYNALLLINLKFLDLNVLFDAYLNAGVVAAVGVIVARTYLRTLPPGVSEKAAVFLFLPVALALFTVTQGSSGAMETQVRIGTLGTLLIAVNIDRVLCDPRAKAGAPAMLALAALVLGGVIVFGTLYSFAWFPALWLMLGWTAWKDRRTRAFAAMTALTLVGAIPAYLIFYDVTLAFGGSDGGLVDRAGYIFLSLLGSLSSATLTRSFWENDPTLSLRWLLLNGSFVAVAYGTSLVFAWRSRMIDRTWLPILMIASSLGVALMVALGRAGHMDWSGGTNYWYAVHTKFGLAGCLWIFADALGTVQSRQIKRVHARAACAGGAALVLCLLISNAVDWRRAPHVRRYFESMVPYAYSSQPMPVNDRGETPFHATPGETQAAMDVFRRHRLTFFADTPVGDDTAAPVPTVLAGGELSPSARLGPGWHTPEGRQRWVSRKAEISFVTGREGTVAVEGFVPPFLAPNRLVFSVNGTERKALAVKEGAFLSEWTGEAGERVALSIECERHIVPAATGLGADQRELAAIITRITTR